MKIEPSVFGGLSITPETKWEEAYLHALCQDLKSLDFTDINLRDPEYPTFIFIK